MSQQKIAETLQLSRPTVSRLLHYAKEQGYVEIRIIDPAESMTTLEARLREIGKSLNIIKVHPHKFRRTLATMAIDKGMPIEQLQRLLGHQRIDTTLMYAMIKQSNVKIAHKKFLG